MRVTPFAPPEDASNEQLGFKPYWVELTVKWGDDNEPRSFTLSTLRLVGNNQGTGFGLQPR